MDSKADQLFGGLAHDLRGPLSAVMGYLDLAIRLAESQADVAKIQTYLKAARDGAFRLNRMVSDLSDVTRFKSGEVQLDVATLTVRSVIDEALTSFTGLAHMKNIQLTVECDSEDLFMVGNRDLLVRMIENLLNHSLKLTSTRGVITIRVGVTHDALSLELIDTGRHLPKDEVAHLFDRFEAFESTSHSGGTGLGLAMARYIAQVHGGKIDVEMLPEKGNRFILSFPKYIAQAKAA